MLINIPKPVAYLDGIFTTGKSVEELDAILTTGNVRKIGRGKLNSAEVKHNGRL